jgi:subtilisin family serine protease
MTNRRFSCLNLAFAGTALLLILAPGVATPPGVDRGSTVMHAQGRSQPPGKFRRSPRRVPDRYVVVLNEWAAGPRGVGAAVAAVASNLASNHGGNVERIYQNAILGFSIRMTEERALQLSLDERVAFVEEDGVVEAVAEQANPPWGLDRIDQRALPLNQIYSYDPTGQGVRAYVIDTGIRFSHSDFGGRAISGFDAIDGGTADDCNGHGTHVAGTIGGNTYGVAKGVTLVGVRVLNCQGSGTNAGVIAGIDWVSSDHDPGERAVANMSLGGGASSALDAAVINSINDGVTYAVAAGNGNSFGTPQNACNYSPARVAAAITVGATRSNDAAASFTNYGTCVDLFAPGVGILSAWYTSNTATNTISGTSMATPHVAGVAALYLQDNAATPQQVRDTIVNSATTGVITGIPGSGSPNRLLYSLLTGAPPPPPPPTCQFRYAGTLSGSGDSDIHPNGTYYQSVAGAHRGVLAGPAGTDFDLALYRWSGFNWTRVAVSESATSTETINYNGTAGYYYWRIYSYTGSGSYTFCLTRP